MGRLLSTVRALALGAGAMYYFDPNRGRARRARLAGQARRLARDCDHYARTVAKRGLDRSRGAAAGVTSRLSEAPVDDDQLQARVRSRLGRLVRYPGAIETEVRGGHVRLRGPVLANELNTLMAGLWHVRGVTGIDNQLSVHERSGKEAGLQGENRLGQRPGPWQRPLLAALGGGALACSSLRRGALFRAGAYSTAATLLVGAWLAPTSPRQRRQRHEPAATAEPTPLAAMANKTRSTRRHTITPG